MELFPAQPDLSLQISPPNTKPTSTTWRRTHHQQEEEEEEEMMDLGFWRRALDSRNSISSSSMASKPNTSFDLSLSNSISNSNNNHLLHPLLQNGTTTNNNGNLIHSFQLQNHPFPLHQEQQQQHNHLPFFQRQQQVLSQDLNFLRPIRGIPVYQNPAHHHFTFPTQHSPTNISTTSSSSGPLFQSQGTAATLMRSRFASRFPAKRSMRAPRMRWTTTLHARFVHAVELLGGHESISLCIIFSLPIYYYFPIHIFLFN